MLKVIFYQKSDRVNKSGESPIYARLSYNDKQISMSTGQAISKERWASTNNLRNQLKIEKEIVIKNLLDLFQLNAAKKFTELFRIDPQVNLQLLKAEITGKVKIEQPESPTIIEIMDTYNLFFTKELTQESALRLHCRSTKGQKTCF
jgi:hypothetical protein